jgi:hypothetical protein
MGGLRLGFGVGGRREAVRRDEKAEKQEDGESEEGLHGGK